MKKILTLTLAILCSTLYMLAAGNVDIIIKTNSEKIEALIQEVSDTEIKYKKANNPNGPMFIIKMDDVSSILYANGEVQAVEHKAQPAPQAQPNYGGYGYNNYGPYGAMNGPMQHIDKDVYTIEGRTLQGKELLFFLQQNCPTAYNYRLRMQKCENAGWALFGVGAGCLLGIGMGCFLGWDVGDASRGVKWAGVGFMAFGGTLMAGSIPMIAVGNIYKKKVDQVFNQYCGRPQAFQPELHLQSSSNGLGLALHF